MICPKCNRENEDSAMFCRYCGTSLHPEQTPQKPDTSSLLLLIWIVGYTLLSVARYSYTKIVPDWYENGKLPYFILGLLQDGLFILVPLAIKSKGLKIAGCIVMCLFILWCLTQDIAFLTSSLP